MTTSIDARHRTPCAQKSPRLVETPNLVRVFLTGRRRRGLGACGWSRRRGLLHSQWVVHALMHAAQNSCRHAVPLVAVDTGRRP